MTYAAAMSRAPDRSNWPSLASTQASGMMIAGICGTCSPPRRVKKPMAELIALLGPDVKTRDVMDRVTCSACGARVPVSLTPVGMGPGGKIAGLE